MSGDVASMDDSESRVRLILAEAAVLLGEGEVCLQVVSAPVVEWVYVALEDDEVVVSDQRATFASIVGLRGDNDEYVEWSPDLALAPTQSFGVTLVDETHRDQEGNVLATAWRLRRRVLPGESVAEVVQAMAHAIDGVFAVHVRPDAMTCGSYFWDQREDTAADE